MKSKTVNAIIEASSTGFGIYAEDENLPLNSYGKTIPEAKENFDILLKEMLAYYKQERKSIPPAYNKGNLIFNYKYDIASIFQHFGMLDVSNFARKIGMNPSLLRQYKTNKTVASAKQKQKIEKGLHDLGRELLNIHL